ncbi:MAG: cytochrome c-type biogenesis protein CcmH [Alphaproteobacteria bacterium]|nr:cytochrome c-type biogenesis protein CcmH [Alphaproteobacteria bacterium]
MTKPVPILALLLALLSAPVMAALDATEMLADPALEARARALAKDLRCVVCQNQSIDDSAAELARDLRRSLRARLLAGDSDEEALAYLTHRYGDYVLLDPPLKPATWALWFAPAGFAAVALLLALRYFRRRE